MSRILATSRRSKRHRQLTLLSPARLANHSASRAQSEAWKTLVVSLPCDSAKSLAQYVLGGLSGKTSPACCNLIAGETSDASSQAWPNSGMGSPTEFWTHNSLESPNDADVCLLSDIIETGAELPQCSLTDHSLNRMQERLRKYANQNNPLLLALNAYSDGLATKRRSTESKSCQPCEPSKVARA